MYKQNNMAQQYQAYTAATMTVGKVRQVVMLYDGAIRLIQQAADAIRVQDYETRFHRMTKASEIITGLQNSLDFNNGGEIARLLHDYYAAMDARIFSVHRSNDIPMCEQLIKELKMMREAWDGIDKGSENSRAQAQASAPAGNMATAPAVSLGAGISA